MNIYTSYFAKNGRNPNAVSIALSAPGWYYGRTCEILAPEWWYLKKYKDDKDKTFYIEQYKRTLNMLDPEKIIELTGPEAILLCWEKPGEFCHRHLAAEWLSRNLKITIKKI